MTQEDLARAIGQSASSITMYETGRREPDFETLEALSDTFNVPLVTLITDELNSSDSMPLTPEARILARGVDHLPQEERQQLLDMARVMFRNIFDREDDHGTEL